MCDSIINCFWINTNKMKRKIICWAFVLLALPCATMNGMQKSSELSLATADQDSVITTVKGTVVDEKGDPIIGASIREKEGGKGVVTDTKGEFSISPITHTKKLIVSYVGYRPKEVSIIDGRLLRITLSENFQSLREVIITGRAGSGKRDKVETSYSVTNIGYNALSLQAPTSVTETLKSVPGFWIEASGGEASGNIRARGVPVDGFGSIQLLEDGIPVQHDPALGYLNADQAFRLDETIDKVEVVRGGPSSVFYPNAPAGAVNYIPRSVGNEAHGLFKMTVGYHHLLRQDFWFGSPIGDGWKLSLGGFYRTEDGVRYAGYKGNQGGQFRVSLGKEWDKSSFNADYKYLNDKVILYLGIPMIYDKNGNIVAVPGMDGHHGTIAGPETEQFEMIQGDNNRYHFDNTEGTSVKRSQLTLKFGTEFLDGWKLHDTFRLSDTQTQRNGVFPNQLLSAASFLDSNKGLLNSIPGASSLGLQYAKTGDTFNVASQNGNGSVILAGLRGLTLPVVENDNDLRISHLFNTGASTHDFNIGYYFSFFKEQFNRYSSIALLDVQNNAKLLNLVAFDANGKALNTLTDNGIYRYGYEYANAHGEQTTHALYVSDEWEVTKAFRIDAGLRWEFVQTKGVVEDMKSVNLGTFATSNILTGTGRFPGYDNKFNHAIWTLGANYQFAKNMGLFARYTSSARIPGLGTYVSNVKATPVTQTMSLGEIGLKYGSDVFSLFATGFYTKYNNIGFTNYVFDVNGTNVPQNLYANTQTFGLELEAGYFPVRWFDITATSTLQSGKYRNFVYTDASKQTHDYNGNLLIRVPTVSIRTVPGFNIAGNFLRIQLPVEYEGKRYVDVANKVSLPGYTKIDLNVKMNISEKIAIFANIDNLTNSLGLTEGNPRQGEVQNADVGANSFIARPLLGRSFKIALRYMF